MKISEIMQSLMLKVNQLINKLELQSNNYNGLTISIYMKCVCMILELTPKTYFLQNRNIFKNYSIQQWIDFFKKIKIINQK